MRRLIVLSCLLPLTILVPAQSGAQTKPTPLVLTHATVIDATGAPPRRGVTVVITDGRITALGRTGKIRVPRDAEVINVSGKFLIPGLWDMHIHSGSYENGKRVLPSLVAQGVTGVRDMGSPLEDVLRLRQETRAGKILGPRMVVAGPLLQGPLPFRLPLMMSVNDRAGASRAVAYLKARGVDFIKVHDALPRELYFAVAAEAERRHLPLAGHVPPSVSAAEATGAGQRSIEHLGGRFYGVLLSCSGREAELTARVRAIVGEALKALNEKREPDDSGIFRADLTRPLLDSFDGRKAARLFAAFRRNRTWQVPTLVAQPLREAINGGRKDLNEDDLRYGKMLLGKLSEVVAAMARAGVKIMAGTDSARDRFALHEELELLVEAGLTPMQALQSATRNPAEFLGQLDSLGTVEKGKTADLVLLDADPLADIRNTRKIHAVILGGRWVAAGSSQKISK